MSPLKGVPTLIVEEKFVDDPQNSSQDNEVPNFRIVLKPLNVDTKRVVSSGALFGHGSTVEGTFLEESSIL